MLDAAVPAADCAGPAADRPTAPSPSTALRDALIERADAVVFETDLAGRWRYLNPAWARLAGEDPAAVIGRSFLERVPHEQRAAVLALQTPLLAGEVERVQQEVAIRAAGDVLRWVTISTHLLRDAAGTAIGTFGLIWDVHDRKSSELAIRAANAQVSESRRLLVMAEGFAHVGHWRMDRASRALLWSDEVYRIHGLEPGSPIDGAIAAAARHPDDRAMLSDAVAHALAGGTGYDVAARIVRPDGSIRHIVSRGQAEIAADGSVTGIFGIIQDVTREAEAEARLRESEARYRRLAETDELTGVASRRTVLRRLSRDMAAAHRMEQPLAVAMVDVDRFKLINDRFGHAVGDAVLADMAAVARGALRGGDVVGRLGGEEFVVIMPGTDAVTAAIVGERLRGAVEGRGTDDLPAVTISIGLATLTQGQDAAALLAAADAALYRAKDAGRNRLCLAA